MRENGWNGFGCDGARALLALVHWIRSLWKGRIVGAYARVSRSGGIEAQKCVTAWLCGL